MGRPATSESARLAVASSGVDDHGDKFSDSIKVIWNGVPDKGMVTWKGTLKPDEILGVASYIYTLRGTKPPNPKPPENQAQPDKPNIYE